MRQPLLVLCDSVRPRTEPLAAEERVIAEVRTLVEAGYREVVISGINLGRWGRDLEGSSQLSAVSSQLKPTTDDLQEVVGRQSLVAGEQEPFTSVPSSQQSESHSERPTTNDQRLECLIRAILDQTSLEKLRISSVEPMDWSDELIGLASSSGRIAKHAHVPMQSGSDAVLRRMDTGPMATARPDTADQMPMAVACSRAAVNTALSSARVAG